MSKAVRLLFVILCLKSVLGGHFDEASEDVIGAIINSGTSALCELSLPIHYLVYNTSEDKDVLLSFPIANHWPSAMVRVVSRTPVLCPRMLDFPRPTRTFNAEHVGLTHLQPGFCDFLSNVHTLNFESNELHTLHTDTFRNMPNLTNLYLAHNRLKRIAPNAFSNLPSLNLLDLSHNHLKFLSPAGFSMVRTANLDLSHNKLTRLTEMQFPFAAPDHSTLVLSFNRIKSISGRAFDGLQSVTIDLMYNYLRDVPGGIFAGERVLDLNLGFNFLESMPDEFYHLHRFHGVKLMGNNFRCHAMQRLRRMRDEFQGYPILMFDNRRICEDSD